MIIKRFPCPLKFKITRGIFFTFVFAFVLGVSVRLAKVIITSSATYHFSQTDWSGGAEPTSTVDDSAYNGWTKYHSASYGLDTSTAGKATLKLEVSGP